MNISHIAVVAVCALLVSCTQSSTIRTSQNTAVIKTSAAPICGNTGAARVAQIQAAIETIKAGYDRYVIVDAASSSNVQVSQLPGSYNTQGTIYQTGPYATVNARTTYTPGAVVVSGSHNQGLAIRMFRDGEFGADMAISARETLGPDWAKIVKNGVHTCAT